MPSNSRLAGIVCKEVGEALVIQYLNPIEKFSGALNPFPVDHSKSIVAESTANRCQESLIQLESNPFCRNGIPIDNAPANSGVSTFFR